ncbi:CRM-domain containing factor CFM3, chloroplastic/mitochondrial-like [Carex rostrata]
MALSPCPQVQANPLSRTLPVFPINFNSNLNSCKGWCLHWCKSKTREVPISLLVASVSAGPPSQSLSESLDSDAIFKIRDKFNNHDDSYNNVKEEKKKRKQKLRPGFNDVTMQRWSRHSTSQRRSFPWQTQRHSNNFDSPNLGDKPQTQSEIAFGEDTSYTAVASLSQNLTNSFNETEADSHSQQTSLPSKNTSQIRIVGLHKTLSGKPTALKNSIPLRNSATASATPLATSHNETQADSHPQQTFLPRDSANASVTPLAKSIPIITSDSSFAETTVSLPWVRERKTTSVTPLATSHNETEADSHPQQTFLPRDNANASVTPLVKSIPIITSDSSFAETTVSLPWVRERKTTTDTGDLNQNKLRKKRSHTELAERTLPELELQRLRDAALRMKERMKVGPAGVTEAVVQAIHDKWKEQEVVKLRFEGPSSLRMTRTHQILEDKTGGLVIWRSGRSVVLYRGMGYEFPCVKSYATSKTVASDPHHSPDQVLLSDKKPSFGGYDWSGESTSAADVNATERLLDELGPRYKDWSGYGPIPVDADLLPGRVPGYKPPYRMLPYKTKNKLRNFEMTELRRLARSIAPHFALGRNREHQGLAAAIVKLWEKSAIAKIAIKRGVPVTNNEIMAEEIKRLTGGTLMSRNKEYLVFYRGNDFLSPSVRAALVDKQQQAVITQDDEELSRQKALDLLSSNSRPIKGHLVAGTLAETTEALSKWGHNQHLISEEEREAMRRDLAVSKHASLVRVFQRKLYLAKRKFEKAERALAKVQEALIPSELPTDLETVTDEERAKFRSIGLKMKAFHLLGRREIFDGTVQNMHLSWKHRELVKIIVKRKNFAQVKHIAISLEAESGGVLISLDKTTKGYAIILYRGKNYRRPHIVRPKNLLTRRQALARSIELQRREALKHHMYELQHKIQTMKDQLEQMRAGPETKGNHLLQENNTFFPDDESDDDFDDEGEEAYLKTYVSEDED